MNNPDLPNEAKHSAGRFTTTHWSLVLAARQTDEEAARVALEKLCRTYWPPLYAYIRRQGHSVEDAQDLTQEFLSRVVHRKWLCHLVDQRGRFRSFLLTFLKHFLSEERARAGALKRGGDRTFVSLDALEAEEREIPVSWGGLTPDEVFDRRWAQAVMSRAADRLQAEYATRGKAALHERIKDLQPAEHGECGYAALGAGLGMSEQAVKNAVHSFRRRYAQLLREEIAQTVGDAALVRAEIGHLLDLFAR